jgi:Na+-exporting ATPase
VLSRHLRTTHFQFLSNSSLGLEVASSEIMNRPPIDSVFNREFAIDIIVYGVILGTMPLLSFVIVVYGVGGGVFGTNCGVALYPSCEVIYRARAIVFVSLTILFLLHAFEMKDPRKSMFRMNLLQNKPLLISVIGGLFALVPTVYIPKLNETVFKMMHIGWEWSLCGASIAFYIIGAESYKAIKRRFFRR